jgi:hypothetical protein
MRLGSTAILREVAACALLTTLAATTVDGRLAEGRQQPSPVFQAGIDLVMIEVQITSDTDAPWRELTIADFEISISGRRRPATSATFLHFDKGPVTRNPGETGSLPDCAFGFHRAKDRATAHYLVGVDRIDADRKVVRQVRVKMADKRFAAPLHMWRSSLRSANPEESFAQSEAEGVATRAAEVKSP